MILYSQYLTQILSKTSSNSNMDGVYEIADVHDNKVYSYGVPKFLGNHWTNFVVTTWLLVPQAIPVDETRTSTVGGR
jgi:hypothetical protein